MDGRHRLFLSRDPYDIDGTRELFLDAINCNLDFQRRNCPRYARILSALGFERKRVESEEDIFDIPALPTLFFKRNRLFSMPEDSLAVKATSSGTKGAFSIVGFDKGSLKLGIMMMLRFFSYHKVISPIPVNYIVLGYEPTKSNALGAAKTAYGTTKFAPALHRAYALKAEGEGYRFDLEGIVAALQKYAKSGFPVRFVGFPAYMYFLMRELKERGICFKLGRRSKILLGGGWKQFSGEEIDRNAFYALIRETLGLDRESCIEFYSAVEHPLPYVRCKNGFFHVTAYARAAARDSDTLKPLPYEKAGLLSFVTPLVMSMPLLSVVTDDMAVMHDGSACGCGIDTPCFELLGRAGVRQIKTCAATAAELAEEKG